MSKVCYATYPAKRRLFERETVPAILRAARQSARDERAFLAEWMERTGVLSHGDTERQLMALHNAARRGRYVPFTPDHCDGQQPAQSTIEHGGDCDQWASVLLACLLLLQVRGTLVSFGDHADPYQHVAVVAEIGHSALILDPKGSQRGADFNEWPEMELTAGWRL